MSTDTTTPKKSRLRGCLWMILIALGILIIVIGVLAALPVEADDKIPESEWGVGATNIEPSWTGLLREWPTVDEAVDSAQANLGYQLFFDPILSGENNYACANCHHPDLGFSDGLQTSVSPDGVALTRSAPSLWNVAYQQHFFWDGRADDFIGQFRQTLTSNMEMNQTESELVAEIQSIEAYVEAFDAIFEDGVTFENIATVIGAFERTLISDGAAFDDYANGDFDALTSQQRRGLEVFRSAATRCFECHIAPTFAEDDFKVIGVPDSGNDIGSGAFEGMAYAFRVPSLRNVALTAPYMHNGHFTTLEEVLVFYGNGAGDGVGFTHADIDRQAEAGFNLDPQDMADLKAFLFALTDETIPERYWEGLNYIDEAGRILLPSSVPSGLDDLIVSRVDNPARDEWAAIVAEPRDRSDCERDEASQTVTVGDGQTIQQAVDCANPGDTILVPPGIYHERISIDQNDITLRGMVDEPDMCPVQTPDGLFPEGDAAPDWPILDGDADGDGVKDLTDGVIASGNNFRMEYFVVKNYTGNGVLVEGVRGVTLRHLFTSDTGLYGVYPVRSNDVLVECNITELATDAGIYVGQSRDIIVRWNLAYDGVTGIEIENSVNADVYENETWNNTGGILVFLLPNIHSKISQEIYVHDNYVHHNNRPKGDATPGSIVGKVPVGSGIFVMATDDSEIYNNRIENNDSFGIALVSLYQAYEPDEFGEIGPLSENNYVHDNQFKNNGTQPDQEVTDAGLPGADILWDARGYGNVWRESDAKMFPPLMAGPEWPGVLERALFQIWNFLGKNI